MHKQNWDDLRFVLAVAETGSVSGAARRLGVNHATVLRRVADFEDRHGAAIFEKTRRGYRVLADKRDVIRAGRAAEAAMAETEQLAGGRTGDLRGKLRIASTDTFCQLILPGFVADLQVEARGLSLELLSANAHVDMARNQIDVSVRPSMELEPALEGDVVAELGFAAYRAEAGGSGWLGLSGPLTRSMAARWMARSVDAREIVATSDSFIVLREMTAVGAGQAVLPCFVGDADPRLQRVEAGLPQMRVPIWVASRAAQADVPRVRMLRSALSRALGALSERLLGA